MDPRAGRRRRPVLSPSRDRAGRPVRLVALSRLGLAGSIAAGRRPDDLGRGPPRRPLDLDGIDWAVRAGERWAIVGPNGSGKTTLLRVAATYLRPSRGEVDILGARIGAVDARELRRRIGFVSAAVLSDAYRMDLRVEVNGGRFWARAAGRADRAATARDQ